MNLARLEREDRVGAVGGADVDFYQAWFGSEGRWLEYLEFLQASVFRLFRHPLVVRNGHWVLPSALGWGLEMEEAFVERYRYPEGVDTAHTEEEEDSVAAGQPGAPQFAGFDGCHRRHARRLRQSKEPAPVSGQSRNHWETGTFLANYVGLS